MTKSFFSASAFYIYILAITAFPVAMLPLFLGSDAAFWLLTGDAYLYLGIAENSSEAWFSFDGEKPTNGFHPLWQWIVWLVTQAAGDQQLVVMNIVAWSAVSLTVFGAMLVGTAIRNVTGSWLLATLASPGVYFLLVGQGLGNLATWNFFSGMEDSLSFALTGMALWVVSGVKAEEPRLAVWLGLGIILALLTLARLDEVFVPFSIGLAWLVWTPGTFGRRLPAALIVTGPTLIALVGYWTYNYLHIGTLMPISGAAKGEGALLPNAYVSVVTFFAPVFDLREHLTEYTGDREAIRLAAFRVAQVVFPLLMAAGMIAFLRGFFRSAPWAAPLAGMLLAVIIKGSYNLLFVNYWHQATWYFAFACGTISFGSAALLAPAWKLLKEKSNLAALPMGVLILVALMHASQNYTGRFLDIGARKDRDFWLSGPDLDRALAQSVPNPKLLEFGDGIVNFTLRHPVRHGFVFAGDIDSLKALQTSRLLQTSYDDGYTILTSFGYLPWPGARTDMTSSEIRRFLAASILDDRIKAELDLFNFEIVHVYEPADMPFIAFRPKG